MRDMQRFLGACGPGAQRVRAFGGARFNASLKGSLAAGLLREGAYCVLRSRASMVAYPPHYLWSPWAPPLWRLLSDGTIYLLTPLVPSHSIPRSDLHW